MLKLALKNILHKPLSLALSLTLFALGTALITVLLLLNKQLGDQFDKNLAGIDLVIGAKGSPLQLILCNMYHIDAPTGNIAVSESRPFLNPRHPLINQAIPLSLGDNFKGYRIVGTTPGFLTLYDAKFAKGRLWEKDFEVVVGAGVADAMELSLGDTFYSAHGFEDDDEFLHDYTEPFRIVGIMTPSGSVIDNLVLCSSATVVLVHAHHDDEDEHEGHADHDESIQITASPVPDIGIEYSEEELLEKHAEAIAHLVTHEDWDITSILVRFKGRNYQTLNMQRNINEQTNLQAATPAIEINRLYLLLGVGIDALRALAILIMVVSGLSVFISLLNALKERRYELALMRVLGASKVKLMVLILLEGALIALGGYLIGAIVGHGAIGILSGYMQDSYRYALDATEFLPQEWYLLGSCIVVGMVAALLPAIQAYGTDIAETLTRK